MGVKINGDLLYKRVEREMKNMTPGGVTFSNSSTDESSLTQRDAHITNNFCKNPTTIASCSSSAESDQISTSGTSSNNSGRPKGSTIETKQNNKEIYDACIK